MITLEEKIKRLEAIADFGDELYADYEEHGLQDTHGAKRAKSLIEEKRQEIAWFRELQERRKAPEIIRCSECTYFKDMAVTVGYCEKKMMYQYKDYFCKEAERRAE